MKKHIWSPRDNIVKVLGESQVALNLGDGLWVGSLDNVSSEDVHKVLDEDQILEVQGLPTAPVTYGLSEGNNFDFLRPCIWTRY